MRVLRGPEQHHFAEGGGKRVETKEEKASNVQIEGYCSPPAPKLFFLEQLVAKE